MTYGVLPTSSIHFEVGKPFDQILIDAIQSQTLLGTIFLSASPDETESPTLLIGVLVRLGLSKSSDNSPSEFTKVKLDNLNVVDDELLFHTMNLNALLTVFIAALLSQYDVLLGKRDGVLRGNLGAAGSDWLVLADKVSSEQQTLSISRLSVDLISRLSRWEILGDTAPAKLNCDEELALSVRITTFEKKNFYPRQIMSANECQTEFTNFKNHQILEFTIALSIEAATPYQMPFKDSLEPTRHILMPNQLEGNLGGDNSSTLYHITVKHFSSYKIL
uniref:Uncharacterized protein n=1 Tax=Glossina pallidipes TaxID=7398 RepID=A0A1B0A5Z9_GLOPL